MEINTINNYLKSKYNCKVYKLSLNGGMTCPNRDGTLGTKGCIFCSDTGAGDFAESLCSTVSEQIESAKKLVENKISNGKYIAYFQSFTNTYAPVSFLEKLFTEAISHKDVVILSIATRPDCLSNSVLDLLNRLNKIKPVWVELGLQTIHKSSADYIRRGYDLKVYDNAVKRLKSLGIYVITHMIIGLPNETDEDITETARYIGKSGSDGIKFHLLHVIKNTDLELDFIEKHFTLPSLEKYSEILAECIRQIPKTMHIHRLTGDGNKKTLIAPLWSADKKKVLNYVNKYFNDIGLIQGQNLN